MHVPVMMSERGAEDVQYLAELIRQSPNLIVGAILLRHIIATAVTETADGRRDDAMDRVAAVALETLLPAPRPVLGDEEFARGVDTGYRLAWAVGGAEARTPGE